MGILELIFRMWGLFCYDSIGVDEKFLGAGQIIEVAMQKNSFGQEKYPYHIVMLHFEVRRQSSIVTFFTINCWLNLPLKSMNSLQVQIKLK